MALRIGQTAREKSEEEKEKRQVITKNIFHYLCFIFHSLNTPHGRMHGQRAKCRGKNWELKKGKYSEIYVCFSTFPAIAISIRKYLLTRSFFDSTIQLLFASASQWNYGRIEFQTGNRQCCVCFLVLRGNMLREESMHERRLPPVE